MKLRETIIASIIAGGITLLGVLIANGKTQAVTETKVDELTSRKLWVAISEFISMLIISWAMLRTPPRRWPR